MRRPPPSGAERSQLHWQCKATRELRGRSGTRLVIRKQNDVFPALKKVAHLATRGRWAMGAGRRLPEAMCAMPARVERPCGKAWRRAEARARLIPVLHVAYVRLVKIDQRLHLAHRVLFVSQGTSRA